MACRNTNTGRIHAKNYVVRKGHRVNNPAMQYVVVGVRSRGNAPVVLYCRIHRILFRKMRLYRRPPQCARLRDGSLFFPPRGRDYFILPVSKRGPGTAKGEMVARSTNEGTRQSGESRARPCGWERIGKGNREVRRIIAREWRGRAQNGCFSITAYDQLCCRAC